MGDGIPRFFRFKLLVPRQGRWLAGLFSGYACQMVATIVYGKRGILRQDLH